MLTYIMPTVDIVYIYNKKNTSGFGIIDKYIIISYYRVDTNDVKCMFCNQSFGDLVYYRLNIANIFNRVLNVDL